MNIILIFFGIFGVINSSKIITISPSDNETSGDRNCNGIDDDLEIQLAICNIKGFDNLDDCKYKRQQPNDPNEDKKGTIILLPGTFNIHQIILSSNIELRGSGIHNTILRMNDNDRSYIKFGGGALGGFVRAHHQKKLVISDLTLDGNKDNQIQDPEGVENYSYGRFSLYTEECYDVTMDKVKVINWDGYGIDPHGKKDEFKYSWGFTIKNSILRYNNWDGIAIDKTNRVIIDNNIIENNGRHGINIGTGSFDVSVTNNIIVNNGHYYHDIGLGCGIKANNNENFRTADIIISGNTIVDSNFGGICLNDLKNVIVSNNKIENKTTWCMKLSKNTRRSIFSNNICNTASGIYLLEGSNDNIFTTNIINTSIGLQGFRNREIYKSESTNKFINNLYFGKVKDNILYKHEGFNGLLIGLLTGIPLFILVVIGLSILIFYYYKRKRRIENNIEEIVIE